MNKMWTNDGRVLNLMGKFLVILSYFLLFGFFLLIGLYAPKPWELLIILDLLVVEDFLKSLYQGTLFSPFEERMRRDEKEKRRTLKNGNGEAGNPAGKIFFFIIAFSSILFFGFKSGIAQAAAVSFFFAVIFAVWYLLFGHKKTPMTSPKKTKIEIIKTIGKYFYIFVALVITGGVLFSGDGFFGALLPGIIFYGIYAFFTREKGKKKLKRFEEESDFVKIETPEIPNQESFLEDLELEEIGKDGSYPNEKENKQEGGYRWTTAPELGRYSKQKAVFIDNFAVSKDALEKYDFEKSDSTIQELESIECRVDALDLTKTVLMVGAMGSGKTEAINNLLAQTFYNRAIINDVKGDFVEKFYRPEIDIVLNLFDVRSHYWDIFAEMEHNTEIAIAFVSNLVKASVADDGKGDFFSNQVIKIINDAFIKAAFRSNTTSQEKWEILIDAITKYKENIGSDKTKSSISLTLELAEEIFRLIAYRSKDAMPFTLAQFFADQKGQRLFLLNNPSVSQKLTPFFTGFLGAVTSIILGQADTKTDFSMFVLDEFYSLNFDDHTKKKLLTQVRSKGGQLILGMQFLQNHEKEKQLLDSSRFALQVFQLSDGETVKRLGEMMGEVIYKETVTSKTLKQNTGGKIGAEIGAISAPYQYSNNEQHRTKKFLDVGKLQSMPRYHHITIIPSEAIIYLGYTPLINLQKTNSNFQQIDMGSYYKFIYSDLIDDKKEDSKIVLKNKKEEEAEAIPDESEEEEWINWYNLKFISSREEALLYAEKHQITQSYIDRIFSKFDETKEQIEAAKARYSEDQIVVLMDDFFNLQNDHERYNFVKEKYLIGALLTLFILDNSFIFNKLA